MAKKKMEETGKQTPAYRGYELSSVSEYYLYGRGNEKDYNRAVKNLREDIRGIAYYGKSVFEVNEKKRTNGSAVLTAIFALLAIAFLIVGICMPNVKVLSLVGGMNAYNMLSGLFNGGLKSDKLAAVAVTVSLAASIALLVIAFISAICRSRARKTGGWLKLVASLSCLTTIWAPVALFLTKESNGIGSPNWGYLIFTALTLFTALSSLIYKEKTEE